MTGTVLPFAGSTAPDGWLLCYGQAVSRTTYAVLFAVIGTTYGIGDGSTTFNVPDLRGRVAAGKDDMGGSAAGVITKTLTGTRASTGNGIISALSSTAGLSIGMKVTGTGIGTNAVISTIDSATQVTLSVNNTATGTAAVTFSVVDGLTLGATGGTHTHALVTDQMPAHQHNVGNAASNTVGGGVYSVASLSGNNGPMAYALSTGGGNAHPNLQPMMVLNSIIKA